MKEKNLSVREIAKEDIPLIINYWLTSTHEHLTAMGVDITKLPAANEWQQMLEEQLQQSYIEKKSYCIIWLINNEAIGHSNINKIKFAEEAYMHLHLWNKDMRQRGNGAQFVKMTLPCFFENYQLHTLYCEPYALNPAPNKTLEKAGFEFVKQYRTTPGWLNFEQDVSLWKMTREQYLDLI